MSAPTALPSNSPRKRVTEMPEAKQTLRTIWVGSMCACGSLHELIEDRALVNGAVLCGGSLSQRLSAPVCAAVFDGVSSGGNGGGAATLAATAFALSRLWEHDADPAAVKRRIEERASFAETRIIEYSRKMGGTPGLTTVAGMAILPDGDVLTFNAGDSRVYRLRDGMLSLLTRDHTPEWDRDGYVADGTQESSHVILRALGMGVQKDVLRFERTAALSGDTYLVCTDGVSGSLSVEDIVETLSTDEAPERAARMLVRRARERHSVDDATALVLRVEEGEGYWQR